MRRGLLSRGLFVFVTPVAAMAQGTVCSEQTIRDAVQNKTVTGADDEFFWSGRYDKPLLHVVRPIASLFPNESRFK